MTPGNVAVAVYAVTGVPFAAAAAQVTTMFRTPGVATTDVAAPGTWVGTSAALGAETPLVPMLLVAVAVKVVDVPTGTPATMQRVTKELATLTVQVLLGSCTDFTVNEVIAEPFDDGIVKSTNADPVYRSKLTAVIDGTPGAAATSTAEETAEAGPVPPALTAATVNR